MWFSPFCNRYLCDGFVLIISNFRKNEKGKTRLQFGGKKLERWQEKSRRFLQKYFLKFPIIFFLQKCVTKY